MNFAERIGKVPPRTRLQVDAIDEPLKNLLWNAFLEVFLNGINDIGLREDSQRGKACKAIWLGYFKERVDLMPKRNSGRTNIEGVVRYVEEYYFKTAEWYQIYQFIEYLCWLDSIAFHTNIEQYCNNVLKHEGSGYTIIEGKVLQITSEQEISSIQEALTGTDKYKAVNIHLKAALDLLSNIKTPDYRNSMKESISAVEALCQIIVGEAKRPKFATALAIIEQKLALHGSLKEAYIKIYGYTSDADGIRHPLTNDQVSVELEDAKYMLVTCTAFINYLIAKLKL